MNAQQTITAKTIGNPDGGLFDNPWQHGRPAVDDQVAIFAFEVTKVDQDEQDLRTYHVAPAGLAREGAIGPAQDQPQGITVRWVGCGTGKVVHAAEGRNVDPTCEVLPDDPRLV
ncbi:hypothetical protein [Amycolatopsis sp. RTGN1]|uniref:hypothetical protein n=1 Tax=Amycolatopsis ponsaeliensis TaxID=2992142 RepID=UPI0025518AF4|nr:hypothetical protein [Amycolatopsis sp. RTGN1]